MRRGVLRVIGVAGVVLTLGLGWLAGATRGDGADEVPAPLSPFEYLIGGWKGTGIPATNKLQGWTETHTWAWAFAKGKPVGMTVEVKGNKALAKGRLTFDADAKRYLLAATDAADKPANYFGTFDPAAKTLTLERIDAPAAKVKERLKLRLNGNQIRYILIAERKEEGSPRFQAVVESGLTKEGESLGGASAANDGPKCIVTGGAATMTVSFEGKSYPLCCTGCREEFNDNPQKYVKKASMRAESAAKGGTPASTARAKDDGSFDGVATEAAAPPMKDDADASDTPAEKPKVKAAAAESKSAKAKDATPAKAGSSKAASLLKQAQALEKGGNTKSALGYYKRIVADFPDAPQAKTAKAKVEELEN